jgi:DNA segregation ATPase FtsK/SpoIIIE-like protein
MKKKKTKSKNNDADVELFDAESYAQKIDFQPLRWSGFFLLLLTIFSFFSLFGQGGSIGMSYFTLITESLGAFAYLSPLFYLFLAYTFLFQKTFIFKSLKLWLIFILLCMIFIFAGLFGMSGNLGTFVADNFKNSFGTIPTLFVIFIVSILSLFQIFETSIVDTIKELSKKRNTEIGVEESEYEEAYALPEVVLETEEKSTPGYFSKFFSGASLWGNKNADNKIEVNHLDDFPTDANTEDEYEEVEVEEDAPINKDYRTDMYEAVSVKLTKEEKEKITVKKLVKKEVPAIAVINKKENEEKLRQVTEKYNHPPISLYTEDSGKASAGDNKENARIIKRTLADFGISVEMDEVTVGPTVTRYALKPAQGVKIEKIMNLSNNIALELGVASVSITRVHEKSLIGIEVPNKQKASLGIGSLLNRKDFLERKDKLTMTLGKDIYGDPVFADMTKMPHLLIAGTTGSGKSSLVHALINSLIYKNSPYDLKFILIDPKKVEFALYGNLPHLYTPVIKDPKKAVQTLNWLVQEMDRRYAILEDIGKQNITSYHQFVLDKYKKAEGNPNLKEKLPEKMPYIVLIIDELADFMMKYPKEMESGIVKLAQMSRAVGIHLILATQRPSTNIITGVIKGNIPSRVALRVASQVDSRVILDQGGAEKLLGYGDLLFVNADGSDMKRIQSPFVREEEIKDAVAYLREEYDDVVAEELKTADGNIVGAQNLSSSNSGGIVSDANFSDDDDKYEQAKEVVLQTGKTSISNLQVRLGTGYARSAKLINMLEQAGVIITVTDNSGKKVKVVAGQGSNSPEEKVVSNKREDILKVEESVENDDETNTESEEPRKKEQSDSFFRF